MSDYRAITVKRKWAELIGSGYKWFEVRRFTTQYRGPLVITISGEKIAYCVAQLTDVWSTDGEEILLALSAEERSYGRWAWKLSKVYRCEPVPCIGKLGLWRWQGPLPAALEVTT